MERSYLLIWLLYLGAGSVFYFLCWRLTRSRELSWLMHSTRALLAALILTPWYANMQGSTLAPAVIVMLLDLVTSGGAAALRAAVPLFLALLAAELLATLLYFLRRRRSL